MIRQAGSPPILPYKSLLSPHLVLAAILFFSASSPHSKMDACSEPETPLTPEDPTPTLATHADIRAGFLKSSRRSAGACAGQSEINVVSRIPFLVNFILGNFAFAMFLISLVTSIVFFAVAWFTVIRDARLMRDQILSNATGVSLFFYLYRCALLTLVVAIGIDIRP